ncbi:MAG: serine hydrolase domain-containing protein [Bacteroidota bacterium]
MKNIRAYLLIGFILTLSIKTTAQQIQLSALETKIDALIPSKVKDSTPGLVIGIVKNGALIFKKGYGLANLAYGIPNDSKMVYNLGSVSKQFIGYAFAILHTQGKLHLDDSVSKYLDNWPEFEHTITIRHLLTHTSGYREAYTMSELAGRVIGVDRLTKEECLNVIRKQPKLEYIPGTRHTYNSTAYVVLAEILKKVTNTPADVWVETNLLQPLEMNNTQIESHVGEVIINAAESYAFNQKEGYTNEHSNRAIFGAADVYSSVEDLAKWFAIFRSDVIGGDDVRKVFVEPYILKDGIDSEYALGIRTNTHNGLKVHYHTGGHERFSTQMRYYPDHDLGIIVISNFGSYGDVSDKKIGELLLAEYMTEAPQKELKQVSVPTKDLARLEGLYISKKLNATLELRMFDESLLLNGRNQLIPTSNNTFGIQGWTGNIEINHSTNGTTYLSITDWLKETYYKVEKWKDDNVALTSYEGKYWSDELKTCYHLQVKDDTLTLQHRWLGTLLLRPISKDFFRSNKGFYVKFMRNEEGKIKGFNVNSERTTNVYFQRSK